MEYEILKDFLGSPDGRFAVQYFADTKAELTDSLAEVAVKYGWARPVEEVKAEETPEPTTEVRRGPGRLRKESK